MKPEKDVVIMRLPLGSLSSEAASAISSWLFGLAHEFDLHYQDEIRSRIQYEDEQRDRLDELSDEEIGF